jgi:hypothetical protein
MAPRRIASSASVATVDSENKLHRPQNPDELALAAIAHARFQQPARMLKRLRQYYVLSEGRRASAPAFCSSAPGNVCENRHVDPMKPATGQAANRTKGRDETILALKITIST